RVFNHITDPIEVPFEGADAPLREIVYEAVDSCWNVSTWSKYLKVKDETVPHVVTDDAIRVSLNHKEEWIAADVFGEGSYDNCGIELELARRTDWWKDPKCVNLCPSGKTYGNWADILVAIGFDRGDVNVILSGGTLNGTYDLDLERLKENILSDTKIEEHYFKSIAWLWEDSDCGEKVVHGWLYEIAKVLSDPGYCGLTDEHGNALNEEVLREFFDRLTGIPGYGKEVAYLGGGWSTDVPFKCEDACEAVTVEYLA
ncbi:hypothetical protein, partial [Membranihabitans maritimus]|uniref:hypothetical protein n=1 Tax=Membranihabitans maritimus TaxID=2904244 RepID=UPI001F254A67